MKEKTWLNKKSKIIMAVAALVLLVVGGTYAWWVANKKVEQTVSMGKLDFTAEFPKLVLDEYYEPGLSIDFAGKIKNTGNLSIAIKIDNDSDIKFVYSDDQQTSIEASKQQFVKDTDNLIELSFEPKDGDYFGNPNAYWFTDETNSDVRILMLEPKAEIEVTNQAVLSGEMGNKYQEATVKVGANLKGTQVLGGALLAELGVDEANMIPLENKSSNRGIQARSMMSTPSQNAQKADQKLRELLKRGK